MFLAKICSILFCTPSYTMNPAKLYFKLKHANADLWIKALQNRTFQDFVMAHSKRLCWDVHTHTVSLSSLSTSS